MDRKVIKRYIKYLVLIYKINATRNEQGVELGSKVVLSTKIMDKIYGLFTPLIADIKECQLEKNVDTWNAYILKSREIQKYITLFSNDLEINRREGIFTPSNVTHDFNMSFKLGVPFQQNIIDYIDTFLKIMVHVICNDQTSSFSRKDLELFIKTLNMVCSCKGLKNFEW
jgi:hypothetical protein